MASSQRQQQQDEFVVDDTTTSAIANERVAADEQEASSSSSLSQTKNPLKKFCKRTKAIWSQLTRSEISGSLGDLGTLIPLLVALARQRSVLLAPALFWAGISNILTGYKWDAPVCVQPMKSISAVALSEMWSAQKTTAAGVTCGGLIFLIGITNLIELVNVIVPSNVVSGIQIGVGLRLASRGIQWIAALSWAGTWDCITLAIVCSALCLYWLRETPDDDQARQSRLDRSQRRREQERDHSNIMGRILDFATCGLCPQPGQPHPVGIYLFLIGALFATIELSTTDNADGQYDLPLRLFGAPVAVWALGTVQPGDWRVGFFDGAIPQIPLTTLNSVISVCALAHCLYPEKRNPNRPAGKNDAVITRKEMSISVGLINIFFVPFGSMPNCHGAGGLAGQHRLGARHGASVVFLGTCKVLLAIFFGSSALTLLDAVPTSVLGVMLAIAGQELATTGFTLLVSSVEKEYDEAMAAKEAGAANVDTESGEGSGRRQEEREGGWLVRNARRRPTSKKLMLRRSTVVATVTTMVTVGTGKTSYGALSGWVTHLIYGDGLTDFLAWCERRTRRSKRRGNGTGNADCNGGAGVCDDPCSSNTCTLVHAPVDLDLAEGSGTGSFSSVEGGSNDDAR